MKSLTSLAILFLSSIFLLAGCATSEEGPPPTVGFEPQTLVVSAGYEEAWRAVQKSLSAYPIQVNNVDQGIIETDALKPEQVWKPPFQTARPNLNYQYTLRANVIRGKIQNQDSTKITLIKKITASHDFFSGDQRLASDGLEEKSILYRVERNIQLERSIRRAFERGKSSK